ncbi:FecR family protein [Membranihabitans maritimus]|uniref:FecR family protein n=1 Tax=Membranihabitans maritimus TaxID=2904244 RepID=UPI001F26404B|nr:FecR domain-containing protein [Membranihabitans maritimus]
MTGKGKWTVEKLVDDESFVHWVKGTNDEAVTRWEEWRRTHPEYREVMDRAKLIVEGINLRSGYLSQKEVAEKWDIIQGHILEKERNTFFSIKNLMRVASIIVVLIIGGLYGYNQYWNAEVVYASDFGERKTIDLPDGSSAELNANSEISFVRKAPRNVKVIGEVFFDVRKDSINHSLFTVNTPDLDIEVLGTAFNVNTRQEKTRVMLERGAVQLKIKDYGDVSMKPGDLVTYSLQDQKVVREENVSSKKYTSWKKGIIMLENITVGRALEIMEETYGVEVIFRDSSMIKRTIKGGIPGNDLNLSLDILRKMYGLNIERNENKLIIK